MEKKTTATGRLVRLALLLGGAMLLSGCVVVPVRGYYWHPHWDDGWRR